MTKLSSLEEKYPNGTGRLISVITKVFEDLRCRNPLEQLKLPNLSAEYLTRPDK
jgi:hypothetical protein